MIDFGSSIKECFSQLWATRKNILEDFQEFICFKTLTRTTFILSFWVFKHPLENSHINEKHFVPQLSKFGTSH